MKKAKGAAPVRLIFEMPKPVRDHIQNLAGRTHAGNKSATVRHALATYEMLIEHRDADGVVVIRSKDGTERVTALAAL